MRRIKNSIRPGCRKISAIQPVYSFSKSLYTALITISVSLLLLTNCGQMTKKGTVTNFGQSVPLKGGLVQSYVSVEFDDGTKGKAWLPNDQNVWDTFRREAQYHWVRIEIQRKGKIWKYVKTLPAKKKLESGEISIALRPLQDISPEKDQEKLCDRIADNILNILSKVDVLKVTDRESSFQYQGKDLESSDIGEQLKVSYVLEGMVYRAGDEIRIALQLIKVSDRSTFWANSLKKEMKDIFTSLDEMVVSSMVNDLKLHALRIKNSIRKL
ncbi:MAG: hypothetical protein GTO45_14475 [Candidatus Aminicenantes bacterium]|nr:hypothetical protein [Candidatus Aminicenantes bacterium]NIM79972.1 hypothetical protein [Candidatus Aminicenantes bacterium]NIN19311.1 hypothetical protein [Candidatus Aminicenantes bacterium]NIN43214.1 hypothetical protein [Candidatus Aminicenantes bacterium]NIN85953.1 hypothetical protein [Candidatus Aminicenantes bacterium]